MRLSLFLPVICSFLKALYSETSDTDLKHYRAHKWKDLNPKSSYRTASPEKMEKENLPHFGFHGAGGRVSITRTASDAGTSSF